MNENDLLRRFAIKKAEEMTDFEEKKEQEANSRFKKKKVEQAEQYSEKLILKAVGIKKLLVEEKLLSFITEDERQIIERSIRIWEVDVTGKLTAYRKGKNFTYYQEAQGVINSVERIIKSAIDAYIDSNLAEWGIDLDDEEIYDCLTKETSKKIARASRDLVNDKISLSDLDQIIEIAIDEITTSE